MAHIVDCVQVRPGEDQLPSAVFLSVADSGLERADAVPLRCDQYWRGVVVVEELMAMISSREAPRGTTKEERQ